MTKARQVVPIFLFNRFLKYVFIYDANANHFVENVNTIGKNRFGLLLVVSCFVQNFHFD